VLRQSNASGRYLLIRQGAVAGPSVVVNGKTLTLGENVRTCNLDESKWGELTIGTESPEATIPAGWRLASIDEARAVAKLGARFGTHVFLHLGCILGGDMSYPIISTTLNPAKVGENWSAQWPCTATNGGQPGSVLRQSNSNGRYILIKTGGESKVLGPSVTVNGRLLQLGDNVRTCNLDESKWNESSIGSENPEATIPAGWRLASKDEVVAIAKLGARFGTHVLLHLGCIMGGEESYPIISTALDAAKAGQTWSSQWPCSATNGGQPGSILRQSNASGRYILIRQG